MILRKITGILILITAAAGMLFSLAGLGGVWVLRDPATQMLNDNLALLKQSLDTSEEGLSIVNQSIQTIMTDVDALQTATRALSQQIKDSAPVLDSIAGMTGKDLPDAIVATQTSLASAQSSAELIDSIMASLSSIPFSPVGAYKPEVPLHTALGRVADNLNNIPTSLASIHTSIQTSKSNLKIMETELNTISDSVKEINENLTRAQKVVERYQVIVTTLKDRVVNAQKNINQWSLWLAGAITFLFVWFFIAQLGLLIQGLDLLRNSDVPSDGPPNFVEDQPQAES